MIKIIKKAEAAEAGRYEVSGDTFPLKLKLRKYGFSWNPETQVWVGDEAASKTFKKYAENYPHKLKLRKS